jgi:hypothetical protein
MHFWPVCPEGEKYIVKYLPNVQYFPYLLLFNIFANIGTTVQKCTQMRMFGGMVKKQYVSVGIFFTKLCCFCFVIYI